MTPLEAIKAGVEERRQREASFQQRLQDEIILESSDFEATHYVVHFEGLGYYAEQQPNYSWSFTDDITKAKLYKTVKGARGRAEYPKYNSPDPNKRDEYDVVVRIRPVNLKMSHSVPSPG